MCLDTGWLSFNAHQQTPRRHSLMKSKLISLGVAAALAAAATTGFAADRKIVILQALTGALALSAFLPPTA